MYVYLKTIKILRRLKVMLWQADLYVAGRIRAADSPKNR
jgi:hypothetical protein